jgi:hypothetical protein
MRTLIRKLGSFTMTVGSKIVKASTMGQSNRVDLLGDRDVEWAWVAGTLPAKCGRVLDVGPATAFTPLLAAFAGGDVTAFDQNMPSVPFSHPNLRYVAGDLVRGGLPAGSFDTIINCSTTEHIGLAGRYGSVSMPDGDLVAMSLLRERMAGPDARMIFTIPVGQDMVAEPYHRIYGPERLPKVLANYRVEKEMFYAKVGTVNVWQPVDRATALAVKGSDRFYAIGLFVLAPN